MDMAVALENVEHTGKLVSLGTDIFARKCELYEKHKEMFVELFMLVENEKNRDNGVLNALFNISNELAEKGDINAECCLANFFSGKYGNSIVPVIPARALRHVDSVLFMRPFYSFALEVCTRLGDSTKVFYYLMCGIVSVKSDKEAVQSFCDRFIKDYVQGDCKVCFTKVPAIPFDKVIKFISCQVQKYNLSDAELRKLWELLGRKELSAYTKPVRNRLKLILDTDEAVRGRKTDAVHHS